MRVSVVFAIAVGCLVAGSARAQMGNKMPIIDGLSVSPSPVLPNAVAQISCQAHDTDGNLTKFTYTVTGGALPNGTATQVVTLATPQPNVTDTIAWTTPGPGNYSVTCQVNDNGGLFGGSGSASVTLPVTVIQAVGLPPVMGPLTVSSKQVLTGGAVMLSTTAVDPEGGPLTWTWTASDGVLQPNGESAVWQAPSTTGSSTVTVTVTDADGLSASASTTIERVLKFQQDGLSATFRAPRRVAKGSDGKLYVVDVGMGQLWMLTRRGEAQAMPALQDPAAAVTVCQGTLWVATQAGKLLKLDPATLRSRGELALASGPLAGPSGLACDEVGGRLFASERNAGRVRAIKPDGTTAFMVTSAGGAALTKAVDVAINPASGTLWVAQEENLTGSLVHAFSLSGTYQRSIAPFGSADGQLSRCGGINVGPAGEVYAADFFQATVKSFTAAGAWIGQVGQFGQGPGQLDRPSGLSWLLNGDLVVANLGAGRLERFGTGVPLPDCPGDSDCDGLPDAWELAFGLNPHDPRDALADPDGDGLLNAEEYALGTNPRSADSDGDGYSDGDEVASGFNPTDPNDHKPALAIAAKQTADPGLVEIEGAFRRGDGSCTVSWKQRSGPAVVLEGATTPSPRFVARASGRYAFTAVAACQAQAGEPADVEVTVRNLPPRPEPGRTQVARAGQTFLLDGAFSSDVNADQLTLSWDQTLGPPLVGSASTPSVSVRGHGPGLYSFQLTAKDALGASASGEVPVVVEGPTQVPTAMPVSPLFGAKGQVVKLDGSSSVGPPGPTLSYRWRQVAGSTAGLSATDVAQPTFVPAAAGRYAFELSVQSGIQQSPWERVDVYVAEGSAGLPVAVAPATLAGQVGQPIALDGTGSTPAVGGATLVYAWRQVSGPAAGLTRAQQGTAMAVPFAPGTYVFELRVKEGAAESAPAFVRLDADEAGRVRPVAQASSSALAREGEAVLLDGSGSYGSVAGVLRYRWTQVSGPWVALDDPTADLASFTPRTPGLYTFELEVDDGQVRSAPARVGVLVFPRTRAGGAP